MIFRRFGALNARALLYLQDQITVLECELEAVEAENAVPLQTDVHNRTFREDKVPRRQELLEAILAKVKEYSKYKQLRFMACTQHLRRPVAATG
jgi:hypothetical protein